MNDPKPSGDSFLQSSEDPLWVSLMYGTVTGVSCVMVGYPLDTVKVRLQMGHSVNPQLFAKPYRGIVSPLLAVSPSWSANFLMYGFAMKCLSSDSLSSVMVAGGFAGLGFAVAVCPFEMLKCNTQGSQTPLGEVYRKLRAEHGPSILYRGFGACACRDVGQGAAYYGFAEFFGRSAWLQATFGEQAPFVVGMLTGLGHCHVELPFDCIKTRMQTDLTRGYGQLIRDIFDDGAASGVRRLFKGYLPWMTRAMICHGSSFYLIAKIRDLTGL
eukprot:TRINITY_DN50534_c0_g1_i1.p1 TRINITY_DN50534_c0_g1~~TRINITY_DN50534_c0_g1_i1.p1  ORF type:complete len:270 (-),score=33.84 TRINITY_DN50534_c0_g1_i1:141-950(-)